MNIDRIEVNGTEYDVEDKGARESIQTLSQGVTASINAINAVIPDSASDSNMLALDKSINVPVLNITARNGTTLTGTLLAESAGNTFHNGQIVEVLISENVIISGNGWYDFTGNTANATNLQNVIGNVATGAGETKKVVGVFRNGAYIDLLYEVNPPTSVVSQGSDAPVTSSGVWGYTRGYIVTSTGSNVESVRQELNLSYPCRLKLDFISSDNSVYGTGVVYREDLNSVPLVRGVWSAGGYSFVSNAGGTIACYAGETNIPGTYKYTKID